MHSKNWTWIRLPAAAAAVALLAACATAPPSPPPPPPPPPPPAVVELVPYRPIPPGGAAYDIVTPPISADGIRLTVNSNLDKNDTTWYFRSAWNVAALNCIDPEHSPILDGYGAFLKQNRRALTATNNAINQKFQRQYGSRNEGVKARELLMTQVYNYFALPPGRAGFCDAALAVANAYQLNPPSDVHEFAAANLPRIEAVFQQFFREYDQYRVDSAAWDVRYGALYGASQPGYVAVHGVGRPTVVTALSVAAAPVLAGEVVDPDSGAVIPIIRVQEETVATPVVQPVPQVPSTR